MMAGASAISKVTIAFGEFMHVRGYRRAVPVGLGRVWLAPSSISPKCGDKHNDESNLQVRATEIEIRSSPISRLEKLSR
jgi:hypothetical protein